MFQTSSFSLYEDVTYPSFSFFLHDVCSVVRYLGKLDLLRPNIFGDKKIGKKPRSSGLGMDTQNMCAKIHGLSFKKRRATGHVNFCSENMCMLRS